MTLSISFSKPTVVVFTGFLFFSGCSLPAKGPASADGGVRGAALVAVLPFENLSNAAAPIKDMRQSVIADLQKKGVPVLDDAALQTFMARHRLRYTGGIDAETARAFREETGTGAILITALVLYDDKHPPKISFLARLVAASDPPAILWSAGKGSAGDDSPGFLGLGLIEDPRVLEEKAIRLMTDSLAAYLSSGKSSHETASGKYQPKTSFRSPVLRRGAKYRVAVLPFFNISGRKDAGAILEQQFVGQLASFENLTVIEPGVVREKLLQFRIIMDQGVSVADAGAVCDILDVDFVLSGRVISYQDYLGSAGKPKVEFSTLLVERKSKEVVWSSTSYNEGDDGVFFFDVGRVYTADGLASAMVRAVVEQMVAP